MPRIPVSFKNTDKDMKIYLEVKAKEEQSEFVKEALRYYIKYLKTKKEDDLFN